MVNIILNGDVANCNGNAGKPNYWGNYFGDGKLTSWGPSSTEFVSSPCSVTLKGGPNITSGDTNFALVAGNNDGYSKAGSYPVIGGQLYHIEFQIKHNFNNVQILLTWFDIIGTRSNNGIILNETGNNRVPNTGGVWKKYTSDMTIPSLADTAVILFKNIENYLPGTPDMEMFIDDVIMDTSYVPPPCTTSTPCFTHSSNYLNATFNAACSVGGTSSDNVIHPITSYNWKFGDGYTGTGSTTVHTYINDGTYNVELSIKNDCEATATVITNTIIVTGVVPPPPTLPGKDNTMVIVGAAIVVAGILAITLLKKK